LADRLAEELNLRVWQAEDPLTCVVRGAGQVLEDFNQMRHYLVSLERGSTRHRA
jgi:rod shape-determining protein MreB